MAGKVQRTAAAWVLLVDGGLSVASPAAFLRPDLPARLLPG
ncbi:hypothetical protein [Amycolatopsis silviterrae]|uniref:Uncharacterized protein n=1 Tax=Amycolatopsis silviterrae TaxID=1656914 RepID=A0ABW5HIV5_9PSEU